MFLTVSESLANLEVLESREEVVRLPDGDLLRFGLR
jgi:hypothetical protein